MLQIMQHQLEQKVTWESMAPGIVTLCQWANIAERFEGITSLRNAVTIYATTDSNIPEELNSSKAAVVTLNLLK